MVLKLQCDGERMKMRKAFILFLIVSLLFGIVTINRMNAQAQGLEPETTMGVEPKSIVDPALVKGSNFTVQIWVRNVTNLAGVEFKLGYNTTLLNATKIDYGGIFGSTYFPLKSDIYDIEEYIYKDLDNSGNVTADDVRLTDVHPYLAGSTVTSGDADIGQALVIFIGTDAPYEKHRENIVVNTVYDSGEYIYSDLDKSGNVTAGDVRLTVVPPYSAGSTVALGDADIGQALVVFKGTEPPYEKHRENVKVNNFYDPGGYLHYSIMESFGEPGFTGDGKAAIITFTVDAEGESVLDLYLTKLGDSSSPPKHIDHTAINGYFANIYIHDVAITSVTVSTPDIFVGGSVSINVTVKNEGNVNETFTVTAYCNSTLAAPFQTVTNMTLKTLKTLTFKWDTTGVSLGLYTISANASVVAGETDVADNKYTDGTVTVSFLARHDIAITAVTPSPTKVPIGQSVLIAVIVKNEGNVNETFTVTAYYNETAIETKNVTDLTPGGLTSLNFNWNTTDVVLGNYTIKAKTSIILDEIDTADNELVYDGLVEVTSVVHDIAITSVTASPATIVLGGSVSIKVTVKNEGNVVETFNVIAYYDTTAAAPPQTLTALGPSESKTLEFKWDTSSLALGNYTIKAEAPPVTGETDIADNTYTDGIVTLTVHDVAVVSVTANPTSVAVGQSVSISVTVENQGDYTESFSVTAKYDNNLIGTANVANLAKGASKTLTFTWNTAGVTLGLHTISVSASVISGETDTTDNTYTDGTVTVKEISTISISADPTTLTLGSKATISGSITPTHTGVSVTIWYRRSGEENWNSVTIIQTNATSQYSYDWPPPTAGTYEVKAIWAGDTNTLGDESDTQIIEVQEAPAALGIPLYAVAGIAIVIAAAIIIYMVKFRKSK